MTEQLDAANVQAAMLRDTIERVRAEADEAEASLSREQRRFEDRLQLTQQEAATYRRKADELQAQLVEISVAQQKAKKLAALSLVGVWVYESRESVLGGKSDADKSSTHYRLTVYEDDDVFIECWRPEGYYGKG